MRTKQGELYTALPALKEEIEGDEFVIVESNSLLAPFEEQDLLKLGYGITNIIDRATASAAELSAEEFTKGSKDFRAKVRRYRSGCLAVLGIGAYRIAFGCREAKLGLQEEVVENSKVWGAAKSERVECSLQAG